MKKMIFLLLLISANSRAQTDSLNVIQLQEIELKTLKINTKPERFPLSLSLKTIPKKWPGAQLSLQEYLTTLPGIVSFNATNYAQDLRISIRGFGARSAFGVRGITLVVDGIPETTPDGQGQVDNLPLSLLQEIELIRGSSSLRYGNASGGVLALQTLENITSTFNKLEYRIARFGHQQLAYTTAIRKASTQYIFHLNRTKGDGYRSHSRYETTLLNTKIIHQPTAKSKFVFQLNLTQSPKAEDAGGQTQDDLENNRRSARERNVLFQAGEKIMHLKSGIAYDYKNKGLDIKSYGFFSKRNFDGKLPFTNGGIVDLNRNYAGHGSTLTYSTKKRNLLARSQLGYTIALQNDERKRYINTNGQLGDMTLNQDETFNSLGLYLIQYIDFKQWQFNAGLRWDSNKLSVKDYFLSNGNASDNRNLSALSPQLGLSYNINSKLYAFTNFSKSYETPTLSELSADPNGNGGFNQLIDIQEARTFEFGLKYRQENTRWSVVFFSIGTTNDLVPYELEDTPGRTFYRNAGQTNRKGIEFDFNHQLNSKLALALSFNYSDFTYGDYQKNGVSLRGNHLPGIPSVFGGMAVSYSFSNQWRANWDNSYRGRLFTQDSNVLQLPSFIKSDLSLIIPLKITIAASDLTLGVNNLFNTLYSDNIRINAFGGRFFEAAPERTFYAGLSISF